jgi:hypothetical protein
MHTLLSLMLKLKQNKTQLIGLFTIVLVLWSIFYLIPEILYTLFTSLLGIVLLLLSAIFLLMKDTIYGLVYSVILIIMYRFLSFNRAGVRARENFTLSEKSKQDFVLLQHTVNPNTIFDINVLEKQVNQEEIDYYNKHGYWPWSDDVIQMYKDATDKNPFIRTFSGDAVLNTQKIYNQTAILKVLSNQSKEGQMLLTGVQVPTNNPDSSPEKLPSGFGEFGYNSGLLTPLINDVIKCNSPGATTDNYQLERIKYMGKGGIYGEQIKQVTKVDYNGLEDIIPGFTFVKGACNPCVALNNNSDYSCPFELKIKGENESGISSVWRKLWSL